MAQRLGADDSTDVKCGGCHAVYARRLMGPADGTEHSIKCAVCGTQLEQCGSSSLLTFAFAKPEG
jgi:hypothetical protein